MSRAKDKQIGWWWFIAILTVVVGILCTIVKLNEFLLP
jgi:hypothetical protein